MNRAEEDGDGKGDEEVCSEGDKSGMVVEGIGMRYAGRGSANATWGCISVCGGWARPGPQLGCLPMITFGNEMHSSSAMRYTKWSGGRTHHSHVLSRPFFFFFVHTHKVVGYFGCHEANWFCVLTCVMKRQLSRRVYGGRQPYNYTVYLYPKISVVCILARSRRVTSRSVFANNLSFYLSNNSPPPPVLLGVTPPSAPQS